MKEHMIEVPGVGFVLLQPTMRITLEQYEASRAAQPQHGVNPAYRRIKENG